ncbi:MAG TPA: tRNA preQ1(34) S-adenosylmethionine ribosyltransferase-isomerase QueA [Terriglobales bacterium]|nr:tRNA preQ1(34) S-adenosylmethionine ribosyltransferase-isomerase QueA [Terriglobales bacterium]
MRVADFDYHLPPERIAQEPLPDRAASRLLRLDRASGRWEDRRFADLPELLRPGDLLVLNNSRVFPARLYGRRAGARAQPVSPRNPAARDFLRGRVEVLLTRQLDPQAGEWEALVHPGRKIGVGERLFFGEQDELQAEVIARGSFGERRLRFAPVADFFATVERIGHVPLPPYIDRPDVAADRERYQTVFARERGSVAAPTAGLHFTPQILEGLRVRGVETIEITLHVGLGTFQPVHTEVVEKHRLHSEAYTVSPSAAAAIQKARDEGRRIVVVGTTSVRTLEHCARTNPEGRITPGSGETDIFIYPGLDFRVAGALLTNFHLPRSTLLMLVCAFAGRENVLAAYEHAVRENYRFYSYGDCMLID